MPQLRLHDSFSRSKKDFAPKNPSKITAYLCGPTVYDQPHIGNARPALITDVAIKLLRREYPEVSFARNITDIDDKIIERANASGEPIENLTRRVHKDYNEIMGQLNVAPPDFEPMATQYVDEMVTAVTELIDKDHAYDIDGTVMFDVNSIANYGDLSGQISHTKQGARIEVDENKRDPRDFVLWKPAKEGEPSWSSPWSEGRPGWHTECTVMINALFPSHIDLHFGGSDLMFPHHENERAQSRCLREGQVGYWIHNALVTLDGNKMAKSAGNVITIRDAVNKHGAMVTRLALLSTHYRHPLHWGDAAIEQAQNRLAKFVDAWNRVADCEAAPNETEYEQEMSAALYDDLCVPEVLAVLAKAVKQTNSSSIAARAEAKRALEHGMTWVGLEPALESTSTQLPQSDITAIENLLNQRKQARNRKDWQEADSIRDQLLARNIDIVDTPKGTTWHVRQLP